MALVVQKYGGTSVGDVERIRNVAKRVLNTKNQGHEVVVVVSAMAGETDKLIRLAQQVTPVPDERELDVLVSTGEQVSIALLAMALKAMDCDFEILFRLSDQDCHRQCLWQSPHREHRFGENASRFKRWTSGCRGRFSGGG